MKIVITGATGFVGRVVLRRLVAAGHELRLATRTPLAHSGAEHIVVGDIGPNTDWSRALSGADAVVHLAARVHVMRDHAGGADEFRRVNAEGTLQLAQASLVAGVRRFVFLSTVKVNGEATPGRAFRADDAPHPEDAYAQSKLDAERGLLSMRELDPVVIRPPLVHGPGAKGNLARLCRLARTGIPVPFGAIDNQRDLIGVGNLASLIETCLVHPAAPGRVFLAADGEPLSTPALYRLISEALGRPARMLDVPVTLMRTLASLLGRGGEVDRLTQSLRLDIASTREVLGWSPPFTAAEGIIDMARASLIGASTR